MQLSPLVRGSSCGGGSAALELEAAASGEPPAAPEGGVHGHLCHQAHFPLLNPNIEPEC